MEFALNRNMEQGHPTTNTNSSIEKWKFIDLNVLLEHYQHNALDIRDHGSCDEHIYIQFIFQRQDILISGDISVNTF